MHRSGVSAVLLAAGAGSRFGGGKLLAPYKGRPLIEAALCGLRESPVDEIIVVVGAEGERLRNVAAKYGASVVKNPVWEEGMSTSVRAGIRACPPEVRAALISLADQPLVGTGAVERLVEAFEGGAEVAVATYEGEPRNPALFARGVWPLLESELSGDKGARVFLRRYPELVTEVPCDSVADPADVDTVEDLRRLEGLTVPDGPRACAWRKEESMKLENEFTVNASMEDAWEAMNDLERVTPCLPGAQLTEQVGDEYKGEMSVKMGPVTAKYNGTVKIEEADDSEHRAVIRAEGKDARGQGTASATISSTLHDEGNGSVRVHVETDMQLTGRVAQFGRGMHKDVAEKVMGRFSECLEKELF